MRCLFLASLVVATVGTTSASADIIDYFKEYRLGAVVSKDVGTITAFYDTTSDVPLDSRKCQGASEHAYHCKAELHLVGDYAPGLTIEQPFERKGLLHHDFAVDFLVRRYASEPAAFDTDADLPPGGYGVPPLRRMGLNLIGVNVDGYFEFGLTPRPPIPNLIFDVGIGLQPLYGSIAINGTKRSGFVLNSLFYSEGDLVVFRWGKAGYVGFYALAEAGSASVGGFKVGAVNVTELDLLKKSYGLTVLTNFP